MRSARWLFSLVWLILIFHIPSAFAMQVDRFPTPSDYSIKMPRDGRTRYYEVPAAAGLCPLALHSFNRIKGWERPPDHPGDPTAIQFKFRRVEDVIEVDLSLVFGTVEKSRTLPRNGLPAESISSYSLRLGESANLVELARFGIEPFEIKVVSSNSRTLDPSRVINRTKSIEVVSIEKARRHYRITYKNISPKKIIAMRLVYPEGIGVIGCFPQSHVKPLMAPGETYINEVHFPDLGGKTQQAAGPDKRQASRFTVAGVVFDDFTYEGDRDDALQVAASVRAEQIQWPRIAVMFKEAVEAYERNKQRAIDKLKKDAAALNAEPDSSVMADMVKRFSPLTERELSRLIYHLKYQFCDERTSLIIRVEHGEKLERTTGGMIRIAGKDEHWLTAQRNGYEEGLRNLLSFGLLR